MDADEQIQEPATAKAYRTLERMIVTLELAPGGITTEGGLIDRLALGRTPVREAIQRLAWEGLVIVRPRAGLEVAPLRAGDWVKVIDARRGVEVVLAQSAARYVTRHAADMFHEAAVAMQAAGDVLTFTTDVGDVVEAGADHPVIVETDHASGEPAPRIHVRAELWARIARPVFYELVERAQPVDGRLVVRSGGEVFSLGGLE